MKTYVIMGCDNYPGAPIREICTCNGRPTDIKNALTGFKEIGPHGTLIPKFTQVEIIDAVAVKKVGAQMNRPRKNIKPVSDELCAQLEYILAQIDAMRAANGEQAAQGQAEKARPPLQKRQSEAEP